MKNHIIIRAHAHSSKSHKQHRFAVNVMKKDETSGQQNNRFHPLTARRVEFFDILDRHASPLS
jgi:hypothetical protein